MEEMQYDTTPEGKVYRDGDEYILQVWYFIGDQKFGKEIALPLSELEPVDEGELFPRIEWSGDADVTYE